MIANKILFDLNNVIVDDQYGFRRKKSTITILLNFQIYYQMPFQVYLIRLMLYTLT